MPVSVLKRMASTRSIELMSGMAIGVALHEALSGQLFDQLRDLSVQLLDLCL